MSNKWIEHIKKWAKDNGMSYSCALSNPKCKDDYYLVNEKKEDKNKKLKIQVQIAGLIGKESKLKRDLKNASGESKTNIENELEKIRKEKDAITKPNPKPTKEPESFDSKSNELQQLIYKSPIDKIKKALIELKYKGRLQSNKVMLNMQLLQNFNMSCIDIGSGFDLLATGKHSRPWGHSYEDELEYYKEILPLNW
jgi:hypothetical protein